MYMCNDMNFSNCDKTNGSVLHVTFYIVKQEGKLKFAQWNILILVWIVFNFTILKTFLASSTRDTNLIYEEM
jgi:hypothetical protein